MASVLPRRSLQSRVALDMRDLLSSSPDQNSSRQSSVSSISPLSPRHLNHLNTENPLNRLRKGFKRNRIAHDLPNSERLLKISGLSLLTKCYSSLLFFLNVPLPIFCFILFLRYTYRGFSYPFTNCWKQSRTVCWTDIPTQI